MTFTRRWTAQEDEELRRLVWEGRSQEAAAQALGRSRHAVAIRIRVLQWRLRLQSLEPGLPTVIPRADGPDGPDIEIPVALPAVARPAAKPSECVSELRRVHLSLGELRLRVGLDDPGRAARLAQRRAQNEARVLHAHALAIGSGAGAGAVHGQ